MVGEIVLFPELTGQSVHPAYFLRPPCQQPSGAPCPRFTSVRTSVMGVGRARGECTHRFRFGLSPVLRGGFGSVPRQPPYSNTWRQQGQPTGQLHFRQVFRPLSGQVQHPARPPKADGFLPVPGGTVYDLDTTGEASPGDLRFSHGPCGADPAPPRSQDISLSDSDSTTCDVSAGSRLFGGNRHTLRTPLPASTAVVAPHRKSLNPNHLERHRFCKCLLHNNL